MNRIGNRKLAPYASRLFQEEVLGLMKDVPREELCAMVDDFIYYQTDEMTRAEARAVVDATCRKGL